MFFNLSGPGPYNFKDSGKLHYSEAVRVRILQRVAVIRVSFGWFSNDRGTHDASEYESWFHRLAENGQRIGQCVPERYDSSPFHDNVLFLASIIAWGKRVMQGTRFGSFVTELLS